MRMRYISPLVACAMSLLVATSCIRDNVEYLPPIENITSDLVVNFEVQDSELITRAAQSTYYEHAVQSIYIFVFNGNNRVQLPDPDNPDDEKNGNINYFDLEEIVNEHNKQDDTDAASSGTLSLGAVSGSNMRVCAVANIGTSNSETRATISDFVSKQIAKFDAITTYDQLQELVVSLSANSVSRNSSFLMTGEAPFSLQANGQTEVTIPLYRTDSKITFNVKAENGELKDFKFIPGKWRVVNVPKATWVLPRENLTGDTRIAIGEELDATTVDDLDATTADELFFDTSSVAFEGSVDGAENSGTFTFYMYENLKGAKANATSYAARELQEKTDVDAVEGYAAVPGQKYVNGDYLNAPTYGTYVVFNGQLSYTHDAVDAENNRYEEFVMADVEYCVHLGHKSESDFNDYKTLRNHHYTYNVTVTGVNDLIVEVEKVENGENNPEERRPGAEGEVVMSASKVVAVDGHYDRALITLTPEEARNILFAVKTPWERGLDTNNYYKDEDGNPTNANTWVRDYKWVKFLINSEVGVADNQYAPYPGEDCYDGGATSTGTAHTSGAYSNNMVTLRDIRQLSNYLSAQPPANDIVVTAFIDEYLYFYDPRTDPVSTDPTGTTYKGVTDLTASDTDALKLWKRSVNATERMMHIVKKGDMNYSWDGETSLSRSVVTIQQKPIISVYNHMAQSLETAWGSEVVNETPKMVVSRTSYNNIDTSANANAYTAAQTLTAGNGTTTWASVISASAEEPYVLLGNYNDPSYACALRNRDLDGNGMIDQNEVLWYLASLDQMTDMWIADPAMPSDKKLYDEDNPDGYYYMGGQEAPATHYVTSTISNSSPMVYWAEEYGSASRHDDALKWAQAPLLPGNENKWTTDTSDNIVPSRPKAVVSLRCIRHFGLAYNDTSMPKDYIEVAQPTEGSYFTEGADGTIDLKYINPAALRTAPDSGAALAYAHLDDVGENNRPFAGFFVHHSDVSWSGTNKSSWLEAYNGEVSGTGRVCPDGYRVPNQREMVLMSRAIDGDKWEYGLYTMFNGQYLSYRNQFGAFYYFPSQKRITRVLSNVVDNNTMTGTGRYINGWDGFPTTEYVRCVKDNPDAKPDVSGSFEEGGEG